MSDRAAFARLDHEALQRTSADQQNEVAELRRELGVVTDERDTALTENERLRANAVGAVRQMERARDERDALSAVVDKALTEHGHATSTTPWCRSLILHNGTCNCWRAPLVAGKALAAGLAAPVGETPDEPEWAQTVRNCPYVVCSCASGAQPRCSPGPALPVEEQHVTLSVPVSNCKTPM